MDPLPWLNFIVNALIAAVAVIAAIIAWKQANVAITAKDDAQKLLKAHENAAAAAARSASAQERQADVAERSESKSMWTYERVSRHRWKLTNVSGFNLDFVLVESTPRGHLSKETPDHSTVLNGESIFFSFGGGFSDPASINVEVSWRSPTTKMLDREHFSI